MQSLLVKLIPHVVVMGFVNRMVVVYAIMDSLEPIVQVSIRLFSI